MREDAYRYSDGQRGRSGGSRRAIMLVLCVVFLIIAVTAMPKSPIHQASSTQTSANASVMTGLRISEIMSANGSAYPDENGAFSDWIEIWNSSDHDISLKGVGLADRSDRIQFLFPDIVLLPDARVTVICDDVNRVDPTGTLHAKFKISSTGETIYLFDAMGFELDSVTVPVLNSDEVYALGENGEYAIMEAYSPGYPNTLEGNRAFIAAYEVAAGTLLLNEVMPAPRSGLKDEDGEIQDWIELYNNSDEPVSLAGNGLSDDANKPLKWIFPENAVIAARGYYVVFCSSKDRTPAAGGIPHTSFSINADKETIILSDHLGRMLDRVVVENIGKDCSYGRDPETSEWKVFTLGTPGERNDEQGAAKMDAYMRAMNPTNVYISEVMASNDLLAPVSGEIPCDYVELYNASTEYVNLSGYGLSDSISWPRKWQFPDGVIIAPQQYMVVMLDSSETSGTDGNRLHANFSVTQAGGETMVFSSPEGEILDRLYLPRIPTDNSYGRTLGESGFFYYVAGTPGTANAGGFKGYAAAPALSIPGGLYTGSLEVTIQIPDRCTVLYTTDGSVPTVTNPNASPYESGQVLGVTGTVVLRARAFQTGMQPSDIVTAAYIMNTYYSLPVVSLVCDPEELWNETNGMYADGPNIDKTSPIPFPNAIYREYGKIARPGYAEMFTQEGEVLFSQGVEMGLIGQYSLDIPQKSFKVMAKASQGAKTFQAALFEDRPFTEYKSFVLRISGNDAVWTRMVDGVQSRLVDKIKDTTVIHQAWKPVVVYLNGVYWGQYNMRERVSRFFVAQHEGLSLDEADSIDILEANSKVYYGSNEEYKALLKKAKTLSPGKNPEDLQYLLDAIDVDNYFDYIIFEAFFANTDTGNIRYYKVPGGKWRWILYDLDYGLYDSNSNGIRVVLNPKGTGVGNAIDNTLIRKFMENAEMKDKFLRRFGVIFKQLTTEVMLAQIDECYAILQPVMYLHFARWAEFNLKSISLDQPLTLDGCLNYWNKRVDRLRNVVKKRPHNCYVQVQEWFGLTNAQMMEYFGPDPGIPADAI